MGAFKELQIENMDSTTGYIGRTTDQLADHASDGLDILLHIPCGFPSPAAEYIENNLNLHDFVVKRPAATFFMRASGDSMTGVGIYPDDVLVIDRSIKPRSGHIVVASVDGEYTLKILKMLDQKIHLMPANPKYKPIIINNPDEMQIFGVLTYNLHKHI